MSRIKFTFEKKVICVFIGLLLRLILHNFGGIWSQNNIGYILGKNIFFPTTVARRFYGHSVDIIQSVSARNFFIYTI